MLVACEVVLGGFYGKSGSSCKSGTTNLQSCNKFSLEKRCGNIVLKCFKF